MDNNQQFLPEHTAGKIKKIIRNPKKTPEKTAIKPHKKEQDLSKVPGYLGYLKTRQEQLEEEIKTTLITYGPPKVVHDMLKLLAEIAKCNIEQKAAFLALFKIVWGELVDEQS